MIGSQELIVIFIIGIMMALVGVLPFWFICKKAGLSPWLALIMLIPFGALVLPFILAFIDWPALRDGRPTNVQQ
jgi:branched-subunit amino acid transport protein AzlD